MIPMVDLKRQYEEIKEEILRDINEVFESSRYILGPKVKAFEKSLAEFHNVSDAVGVASGTDALNLALKAIGIEREDEVITTPFTFFATVEAILYQGAKPVFVDVEPETFNLDPEKIEQAITKKTKALVVVHLFGHPANMPEIMAIAKRYGLRVIEDCAQAFGASINGKLVGTFGDIGCFSFYPSKNLGACGDGGAVITADSLLAERIRMLRNHGSRGSYIHETVGLNSRLDEIQAAVLNIKLKRIKRYNELRRKKAAYYTDQLSGIVKCPVENKGFYHVYHQYTICSPYRDKIKDYLGRNEISSVVYYPLSLHLQKALSFLGYKEGNFPVSERLSREVLSIPIFPELSEAEQEIICVKIKEALKDGR
ncbi:MAG: DegT/DnrJ/EryC1/StrS family aminotransferase [Nitrospirae bacterium]|nr:DegT/DnrJ/EryC1/StrS family aminotransferase [Nitrospirota bacterium]